MLVWEQVCDFQDWHLLSQAKLFELMYLETRDCSVQVVPDGQYVPVCRSDFQPFSALKLGKINTKVHRDYTSFTNTLEGIIVKGWIIFCLCRSK